MVVERKRSVTRLLCAMASFSGLIALLVVIRALRHGFVDGVGPTMLPILMTAGFIYMTRHGAVLAELDDERFSIVRPWYGEDVMPWQNLKRVRLLPFNRAVLLNFLNQHDVKRHWLFTRGQADDGVYDEVLEMIRERRPDLFKATAMELEKL